MAKSAAKKKAGRPRVELDDQQLEQLMFDAARSCSIDEIAANLSKDGNKLQSRTLKRRLEEEDYRDLHQRGILRGKRMLRSRMFALAMQNSNLNVAERACEFLCRTWLGMTEKTELEVSGSIDVEVNSARDRVTRKLEAMAERIARRVDGIAIAAGASARAEPVE